MSEVKPHKPSLLVFVHGFDSATDCWTELRGLLEKDERVATLFDLAFFSYRTEKLIIIESLPSLSEVADKLASFIEGEASRGYGDITLVGHSMGGLVIQTYIKTKLKKGQGDDLARLRQVILFATPSLGSLKYDTVRRIVGTVLPNLQEEKLRVFDPDVSSTQAHLADRVVDAARRTRDEFPVPFLCFYGEDDDIVPEPSVRGRFDNVLGLPGNHSSIIRPARRDDPRYTQFAAYLLEPVGHRNFFEIEEWGVSVRVEPRDATVPVVAVHGEKQRKVFTDNYARLTRAVKFSRRNRCRAQFELSYKTRGGGWVAYTTSHPNEIGPQVQRDYDDDGFNACFKFTPRVADDDDPAAGAGELFHLDVDIYKGFDEGARDLHFHLADYASIYHRIFFRLDLSAYLSAGYDVADEPKLYLHDGPNTCGACRDRDRGEAWPTKTRDPLGVWEWEINGARDGGVIRDGIVDVKWDVAKKS
jgi:pimeloyl-ACP methyl ester carboxylesterase